VTIKITQEGKDCSWELKAASVVGVVTQAEQTTPLSRQYLMSPLHFDMINKKLAQMTFNIK
jgi:hypothetical protein